MLERPYEYKKMSEVELVHWWYKHLYQLTEQSINSHFNHKNISILDAGCGTGGLLWTLKKSGYDNISGFDVAEEAVAIGKKRDLYVYLDKLQNIDKRSNDENLDVIVSNDTLYFLNNDEQKSFIDSCHSILKNKGILIINVPALNIFKGMHDRSVGINDRFDSRKINKLFSETKFSMTYLYWPFFLSPIIASIRLSQRVKMYFNKKIEIKSDIDMPPLYINKLISILLSVENKIPIKPPFGSSLFIVAKKV